MDKLIKIASQKLGLKGISRDQGKQISTSEYDTNTVLVIRRLSPIKILNLPEPTIEKRDQRVFEYLYGILDFEKNQSLSSSISNILNSKIPWIHKVIKDELKFLWPYAKMLEAKINGKMVFDDVKINSDSTKN